MSRDNMGPREVRDLGMKLFGRHFNGFLSGGLCYIGKFLDDKHTDPPHRRKQEIYGVGATFAEAFRFFMGAERVYSIAGVAPGGRNLVGFSPKIDRVGRIVGWESREGVFYPWSKFPGTAVRARHLEIAD